MGSYTATDDVTDVGDKGVKSQARGKQAGGIFHGQRNHHMFVCSDAPVTGSGSFRERVYLSMRSPVWPLLRPVRHLITPASPGRVTDQRHHVERPLTDKVFLTTVAAIEAPI